MRALHASSAALTAVPVPAEHSPRDAATVSAGQRGVRVVATVGMDTATSRACRGGERAGAPRCSEAQRRCVCLCGAASARTVGQSHPTRRLRLRSGLTADDLLLALQTRPTIMQRIAQHARRALAATAHRGFSSTAASATAPAAAHSASAAAAAATPLTIRSSVILRSGARMPLLGLGTWRADAGLVGASVTAALDAGYRSIDGAAVYGNEAEVGAAIAAWCARTGTPRSDLFITNKLWNTFHAPSDVRWALERSLRLMQLDYFDLFLVHWPVAFRRTTLADGTEDLYPKHRKSKEIIFASPDIPLADTWGAMVAAQRAGLTRDIGVSNCTATQVESLCSEFSSSRDQPSMNQVESHPFCAQHRLAARLAPLGVGITAYSPLGNIHAAPPSAGIASASASSSKAAPPPSPLVHPLIREIAASRGVTPAQVLLRWNLQLGRVVLPKSVRAERIRENAALFHFELTAEDMQRIETLNAPPTQQRFLNPTSFKREPRKYFFTEIE